MKKVFLFTTALFFIEMTIAQIGSWPAPPNQVNFTSDLPYASIIPNGFNFSYSGSEGAYNDNGDLLFYTVKANGGGRAVYEPGSNNQVGWLGSIGDYDIESEQCIITPVPGQTLKYYVIYTLMYPPDGAYLAYSIIDCNDGDVSIETNSTAIGQSIGGAFLGLVLSEINDTKYIYVTGGSAMHKYQIYQSGISFVNTVADNNSCPLDIYDFETNFLDVSLDGSKLAWIKMNVPPDEIVVMDLDQYGNYQSLQQYPMNPNAYGYIRGIQFTTEPEYELLYFTGSDNSAIGGVFSLDLNNGIVTTFDITNEFGLTLLQTGSDGLIYGVANDGSHLGRINPLNNTFENNVLNISVNSNGDVPFYEWGNIYHLASNSTFREFKVIGDKSDESCAGYNDGSATANPEGGVEPYTFLWNDPGNQTTQTAVGLSPGTYTCIVHDAMGREETLTVTVETNPMIFNYPGTYSISNSVVWNNVDYQIKQDIIIEDGGTLTISGNSNVEFNYNAGFKVMNGGVLRILDNSDLSGLDECEDNIWNGIYVNNMGYCEIYEAGLKDCFSEINAGGTLRVMENGLLQLQANTEILVKTDAYLCFDETSTLDLVDPTSVLDLEPDYIEGVNPDLNITPAPNCVDICDVNQIGAGYINIDELFNYHSDHIISNSTNWVGESFSFKKDLIIESKAVLTLTNCNLYFNEDSRIIVHPKAKLIIDGSSLNSVDHCLIDSWEGIQVWGDASAHQYLYPDGFYHQGYLELRNYSVIENARIAVNSWNPDDWTSTGGILSAYDATFRNNANSVHALYFHNYNPYQFDQQMPYQAVFKNCIFEISDTYLGTYKFYKHIDLNNVNGVKFRGCDFSLSPMAQNVQEWNKGIAAYNSGFDAVAYCTSTTQPCPDEDYDKCTFTGFYRGIYATGDLTTINNSVYVNRVVFDNNSLGAEIVGVHNPIVLNCDFNIGFNNTTDQTECLFNNSFGIYLDGSTGFAIEENEFAKFPGAQQANYFGIVVKDGAAVNEIYRNTFEGISYANYSEGRNWGGDYREGLAYFCNENSNNYADFFVADLPNTGVQDNQGNDEEVAGNTFSQTGVTWHFYNGGFYRVGYYYCDFCPDEIPDEDKLEYTTEEPKSFDNACLSHYGGGEVVKSLQQKLQLEQDYYANLTDYNSVKAIYDSYLDGGDTDGELLDIQTAQPVDMWALRSQLLGHSPHLSQEVLMEAAERTDVFPDDVLLEILSANPDELKKDNLISYLENKEDPLPEYMIDILIAVSTGTTYKTVLEHQMSKYKRNMVRACHDMIRSILNDSVSDNTELRNWFDNLGGIRADEQIIASYVEEENFTDAIQLANMLPQLYGLSGNDSLEHSYYMDMLNLHQLLHQQGRNTMQLTQSEIDQLAVIAANINSTAGAQARGLLEYAYGYHFPCCPNVDANAGYKNQGVNMNALNQAYGLDITVNPNPASQWASFSYSLPAGQNAAVIYITDVSGKNIINLPVSGRQGQKTWDTRDVDAGVYIYTLKVSGMSKSGKIIISK